MTSLTAEAGSLFSRRVRCVKGQSGPEDVACGVFVGLCRVPARVADEFRLTDAVLPCREPTGFTAIGGVPGVDLYPGASSVFRFGAQNRDELAQPASLMLRLSPVLAAARFGNHRPGRSGVGTGLARRIMLAIARCSTTIKSLDTMS